MRRISGSTALPNGNGQGKTGFQDLDPNLGILGTIVTAAWMNAIQEELASLVEAAGLTLSDTDTTQVARAIKGLGGLGRVAIAAGAADAITAAFTPPIATLTDGLTVLIRAAYANAAAAPTFAAGTTVAKPIVRGAGTALTPGDIAGAGHWLSLSYDATLDKWVLANPVRADLAPLASPALSGVPTAPTPSPGDATTTLATTAFVTAALAAGRAGGGLNKIRNAGMTVASRGLSGSVAAGAPAYTLDGWIVSAAGAAATWARIAGLGRAPYGLALTGGAATTAMYVEQRVEGRVAAPLAGRTVTFQCRVTNGTAVAVAPTLFVAHLAASDEGVWSPWGGATTTVVASVPLQSVPAGATAIVSKTFDMPIGAANGALFRISVAGTGTVRFCDFDARASTLTETVEVAHPVIERLICARYLPAYGGIGPIAVGGEMSSATVWGIDLRFDVPARVAPTGMTYSALSDFVATCAGMVATPTTMTLVAAYETGAVLGGSQGTYSWSQGWNNTLRGGTASARLLFTGVEL